MLEPVAGKNRMSASSKARPFSVPGFTAASCGGWFGSTVSAGERFERLIAEPEKLSEAVSEFDDALWGCQVEYMTVGKDKMMVSTLLG